MDNTEWPLRAPALHSTFVLGVVLILAPLGRAQVPDRLRIDLPGPYPEQHPQPSRQSTAETGGPALGRRDLGWATTLRRSPSTLRHESGCVNRSIPFCARHL